MTRHYGNNLRHCNGSRVMTYHCAAAAAAAGRWLRCIVRIIGFCTSPALMTHSPPQAGYLDTGAMVSVVGQIATVHAPAQPHPRRKQC